MTKPHTTSLSTMHRIPGSTLWGKNIGFSSLETNFKKFIVYKTEMTASAEIVTEDLRLIERLFHQIKRMLLTH